MWLNRLPHEEAVASEKRKCPKPPRRNDESLQVSILRFFLEIICGFRSARALRKTKEGGEAWTSLQSSRTLMLTNPKDCVARIRSLLRHQLSLLLLQPLHFCGRVG